MKTVMDRNKVQIEYSFQQKIGAKSEVICERDGEM